MFSREGGTGWDASEATRLVRAASRATPTTRMAPSRSNFPYPAPTTASKREDKAVTSGRSNPRVQRGRSANFAISARRIVVRAAPAPSSPAPSAHRFRLRGLTAWPAKRKTHPCLNVKDLCRLPVWLARFAMGLGSERLLT